MLPPHPPEPPFPLKFPHLRDEVYFTHIRPYRYVSIYIHPYFSISCMFWAVRSVRSDSCSSPRGHRASKLPKRCCRRLESASLLLDRRALERSVLCSQFSATSKFWSAQYFLSAPEVVGLKPDRRRAAARVLLLFFGGASRALTSSCQCDVIDHQQVSSEMD